VPGVQAKGRASRAEDHMLTKTEREVWVAAFAQGDPAGVGARLRMAHRAVSALRASLEYARHEETDVSAMLREVLAADGGEDG
jgi:hypothetical protein